MPFCSYLERNDSGHLVANLNQYGNASCEWVSLPAIEWSLLGFNISGVGWATNETFSGALPLECPSCASCPGDGSGPIDYSVSGAIFVFFFGVTLGFWLLAKKLGLILEALRRW